MSLLKVVLYARVSTTDQTCENQLRELRDYCARRDWEIAELEKPATWKLHAYQAKQLRSKDAKGVNACKVCGLGEQHAMHTGHFGEYVDTGWSGSKASRPEFDRLMKDASLRNIDCVCVWKLDRFGRSVINMVEALKRLSPFTFLHTLSGVPETSQLYVRTSANTQFIIMRFENAPSILGVPTK